MLEIFRRNGAPSDTHAYLFNGDFVDRGSWSCEIALLLYAYKWLRPNGLFLNRGNHETDDMNKVYGFEGECKAKYNERVFKVFSESFSALPLATLIGDKYLVLHGGLFSDDKIKLDDIRKLNRHNQRQPGQAGLMMEMLWTDPQTEVGRGPSKRGVGLQFGPDVTKRFCENNGLEAIIRSHEVRMGGYEVEHDGRCITVFSAPKYCDSTENKGAYINIGPELKLAYEVFEAVPHPDIKPMVRFMTFYHLHNQVPPANCPRHTRITLFFRECECIFDFQARRCLRDLPRIDFSNVFMCMSDVFRVALSSSDVANCILYTVYFTPLLPRALP